MQNNHEKKRKIYKLKILLRDGGGVIFSVKALTPKQGMQKAKVVYPAALTMTVMEIIALDSKAPFDGVINK